MVGKGKLTLYRMDSPQAGERIPDVSIQWLDAAPSPQYLGDSPSESVVSYIIGNDSARWATNLPTFERVRVNGLYPGIDLLIYLSDGELKFDYIVHPGADPAQIRWKFSPSSSGAGDSRFTLAPDGSLRQAGASDAWILRPPITYQEHDSVKQRVAARYVPSGVSEWALEIGGYDRALPLIVDPVLSYSSYHGGSQFDQANAVAVDAANNLCG